MESTIQPGVERIVRGYHLDLFGHVNNCRYLEFLEDARWDVIGSALKSLQSQDMTFLIANININYRFPATLGQVLWTSVYLKEIKRKSFVVGQEIIIKPTGQKIVDATVTSVIVHNTTGKALELDENLREFLEKEIPSYTST